MRFHLKQFDDVVGGVVEQFELDEYLAFSQQPAVIDRPLSYYQCARLDQGHVRGGRAYLTFTDVHQRRWQYEGQLKEESLHGHLDRLDYNGQIVSDGTYERDMTYLLPEDAAFRHGGESGISQMVLRTMERYSDKSFECVDHYRDSVLQVRLPSTLDLSSWCEPSAGRCDNIRLAVVMARGNGASVPMQVQTYLTARLDDCDISPQTKQRLVRLRSFADFELWTGAHVTLATVVVFDDLNGDGYWNLEEEPVLAQLSGDVLVFAPDEAHAAIVNSRRVEVEALLSSSTLADSPRSWRVYQWEGERIEGGEYPGYSITHLLSAPGDVLVLKAENLEADQRTERGCYIGARPSAEAMACVDVFPVIEP